MPDDPRDVPGLEAAARAMIATRFDRLTTAALGGLAPTKSHRTNYIEQEWQASVVEVRAALAAYLRARADRAEKSLAPGRYAVWLRQMADEVEVREERADA